MLVVEGINNMCAVFGIYGNKQLNTAMITAQGLSALQHRGQESTGITTTDGEHIYTHKDLGLVSHVYNETSTSKLKGHISIGHNRYGTSSKRNSSHHIQPVIADDRLFSMAHNGNLPDTAPLEIFLDTHDIYNPGFNDSEMMYQAVAYFVRQGASLKQAVIEASPLFTGIYCLLFMDKKHLIALRDPYGVRPLSIGRLNDSYIIASETCAIDTVKGEFLRDVNPGEIIIIENNKLESIQLKEPQPHLDIFEFVYFARPDSMLMGQNVYSVRKRFGAQLAAEYPLDVDMVIPVPDSGIPSAIGYAQALRLPYEEGLTKNRYVGRTFILPNQEEREKSVARKLNPISDLIKNKKVALVDDSVVRGTTSRNLVKRVFAAGAKEVHLLITSPRVMFPDFYGIDTPSQAQLIAARKTLSEIQEFIGATSLYFLSYAGMIKATTLSEKMFTTAAFTGNYPADIGRRKREIIYEKNNVARYIKFQQIWDEDFSEDLVSHLYKPVFLEQ